MEVLATKKESFEECSQPGDYFITRQDSGTPYLVYFLCPCGCGSFLGVSLKPVNSKGWEWSGSEDKLTITPSIRHLSGCQWHGFWTDGVFKSC